MLEILSETKNPNKVHQHLKKCFEGTPTLNNINKLDIEIMKPSEGEELKLEDIISTGKAHGQVEKWLLELEGDMKKSIHVRVGRHKSVLKWVGQCVQSISLVYYT